MPEAPRQFGLQLIRFSCQMPFKTLKIKNNTPNFVSYGVQKKKVLKSFRSLSLERYYLFNK